MPSLQTQQIPDGYAVRNDKVDQGLFHVGVEDALLLQIVRHGILGQERRLQADFGADPFAFCVRGVGRVVAASAAAELRAEIGGLDLIELVNLLPGLVAYGAGDVDFEA